MNAEALRAESSAVQEAWEQTRTLNKVMEQSLLIASAVVRGVSSLPEGAPSQDAPESEWLEFWVVLASKYLAAES